MQFLKNEKKYKKILIGTPLNIIRKSAAWNETMEQPICIC